MNGPADGDALLASISPPHTTSTNNDGDDDDDVVGGGGGEGGRLVERGRDEDACEVDIDLAEEDGSAF